MLMSASYNLGGMRDRVDGFTYSNRFNPAPTGEMMMVRMHSRWSAQLSLGRETRTQQVAELDRLLFELRGGGRRIGRSGRHVLTLGSAERGPDQGIRGLRRLRDHEIKKEMRWERPTRPELEFSRESYGMERLAMETGSKR